MALYLVKCKHLPCHLPSISQSNSHTIVDLYRRSVNCAWFAGESAGTSKKGWVSRDFAIITLALLPQI